MTGAVTYSVVVPVYNSNDSVRQLVAETRDVLGGVGEPYEIVLVDDRSTNPKTWPALRELATAHPEVTAVRLNRNFGKAAAVVAGMSQSLGQWVITIDDDLEQSPRDIPLLIAQRDHDVVVGNHPSDDRSLSLRATSRAKAYFDRRILGVPVKQAPLKLIRRRVVDEMVRNRSAKLFIPALLSAATSDFVSVTVPRHSSRHGRSRYNLARRLAQFLNLLVGNSSFLLRFIGSVGAIAAVAGFIYALYVIAIRIFRGETVPGFPSLMVAILVLNGLVLVTLAIIGEYLIRILENTSGKPSYVIGEVVRRGDRGGLPSPSP